MGGIVVRRVWQLAGVLVLTVLAAGCTPRTFVRKDPQPCDRGVRYYRPKPYLKVAPHVDKQGKPSDMFVSVDLAYLPDFSEEYSIHVRSGLGTNDTSITLDQGWNLTQLNVDIDSKTAENVEAVGSLLSGAADFAAAAKASVTDDRFIVQATNVPIGYYEAVIGKHCGRKQLFGFRYVGFLPFSACPQVAYGSPDCFECHADSHQIYGLVFENGVMTFKSLGSLQNADAPALNRFLQVGDVTDSADTHGEDATPGNSDPDDHGLLDAEIIEVPTVD